MNLLQASISPSFSCLPSLSEHSISAVRVPANDNDVRLPVYSQDQAKRLRSGTGQ
jgi:hypothetical protein